MKKVIKIPSIDDTTDGYRVLMKLANDCRRAYEDLKSNRTPSISLNFEQCKFLKQNGVSYLGAISNWFKYQGILVYYQIRTLTPVVYETLKNDGFLGTNFSKYLGWSSVDAKHVKFNHFVGSVENVEVAKKIQTYITQEWLAKSNIHFADKLKQDITARLYELFANALEHSQSPVGCIASGQSESQDIDLCVIDLGIGIVENIKSYYRETMGKEISSDRAMREAFMNGFTTRKDNSGGLGLPLIEEFLRVNKGSLDVYCNDVHLVISPDNPRPVIHKLTTNFYGTILNVKLKKDGGYYSYK